MNSLDLFNRFRADIQDEADPPLWLDDEIWEYMDDAQKMFCRLTWGIADSRSVLTQIDALPGEPWADISPRIIKIRTAQRGSDFRPLRVLNAEDLPERVPFYNDYGIPRTVALDDRQGPLGGFVVGLEPNTIRWVPVPNAVDVAQLSVYRMPLEDVVDDTVSLEIDPQHHIHLLSWMKYRAYSKDDADTFDKTKAAEAFATFDAYCGRAKHEREMREHKYRTVAYGGI